MHVAGSSQRGRVEDTSATVDEAILKLNAYAPIALTKVFPHTSPVHHQASIAEWNQYFRLPV